jgi:hypothetical protein
MIVRNDDGGSVALQGEFDDFPRMHARAVDGAASSSRN